MGRPDRGRPDRGRPHPCCSARTLAAGNLWSESTVTWNNAPATDGSVAPVVVGSVSAGTTIEVDVTPLLNGNVLSLRVTSPSSNGADYSSKEGAAPPQLAVIVQ